MGMKFRSWSYRSAEEVINSKLQVRKEIEEIIRAINFEDVVKVSESKSKSKSGKIPVRGALNEFFKNEFLKRDWEGRQGVRVFDEKDAPKTKVDFLKDRVAVEVAFVHADFLGNDLLKFQMMSYSLLNKIDVGVYIVITKELAQKYDNVNFEGSIEFDKVTKYLPAYKSSIQVPIFVIGLEG